MKLNQILLFAGAWAASEDDERFKNPIKKIEKLQSWGEGNLFRSTHCTYDS